MQVARALALKFDLGCFEGSGTAPEIRGLKNVVGITLDATLAAAPANLDVFANAITTLETNNAIATAIVMHPRTWGTLSKIKEGTASNNKPLLQESAGSGGQAVERHIYGVPVFLSSQLSIIETAAETPPMSSTRARSSRCSGRTRRSRSIARGCSTAIRANCGRSCGRI